MTTDMERELRELFRDKAGEAPASTLGTSGGAPQQVLRRGRRRQVGTVLGSVLVAAVLAVGSFAGLRSLIRSDTDPFQTGDQYEVFQRTATIEAFTITSPSDWYLVNEWPLSMLIAVEGNSGSSSACGAVPGDEVQECNDTPDENTSSAIPVPHGLPMIQLSNVDLGLDANVCRDGLPTDGAALYVAFDAERAISGIVEPSIPPFPPGEPGLPPEGDGPCGPGRYAHFTVNGEPFLAWIGLGSGVTDEDREAVETAYERMSAIEDWSPVPPDHVTPAYVIAGGTTDQYGAWRIEVRPTRSNVEMTMLGVVGASRSEFAIPEKPVDWCCEGAENGVLFGAVQMGASGVEFRSNNGGEPIAGTIVPSPASLAPGFDLFFLEGADRLTGDVVALGIDEGTTPSPRATPESGADVVTLSGGDADHTWIVRFSGSFVDRSACIRVRLDAEALDSPCSIARASALAYDGLTLQGWLTDSMYLLAGALPTDGEDIRSVRAVGGGISELQCTIGPVGWHDRNVCVAVLPPEAGSGTIQYLDSDGNVLIEGHMGGGRAVEPVHGGTYWAVYPWVGAAGSPEADDVSAQLLAEFGIEAVPGDLSCDEGAAAALGTDAPQGIGVYFETEDEANAFAVQAGLLGHEADPVIAQVTTYCLD